MAPSAARRRWFRLGAVLVPVALYLLAELTAAVFFQPEEPPLREALLLDDERLYRPDPELLWTLRPGEYDIYELDFLDVRVNGRGLRENPERGPSSSVAMVGTLVVCLGDSVTFGYALKGDETMPAQLATALAGRVDGPVHVINGGVPGYSSIQGERLLARLDLDEPDVIVFWFGMNDTKPALAGPDSEVTLEAMDRGRFASRSPLARAIKSRAAEGAFTPRVSPEEHAAVIARIADFHPQALLVCVEVPSRFPQIVEQLAFVARAARDGGYEQVYLPERLASPYAAWEAELDSNAFGSAVIDGERTLDIPGGVDYAVVRTTTIERSLAAVSAWMDRLEATRAVLPKTRIPAESLFPDARIDLSIADSCHLTPDGARQAAGVIADRIVKELTPR